MLLDLIHLYLDAVSYDQLRLVNKYFSMLCSPTLIGKALYNPMEEGVVKTEKTQARLHELYNLRKFLTLDTLSAYRGIQVLDLLICG